MADGQAPGKYVLVLEDDPVLCKLLRWMLEDEGINVRAATDSQEALDQAREERPAAVVLDLGLPLINGEEFAAQLRAIYPDTDPPFIVVSGDTSTSIRAKAMGAAAFFQKPFDIDELAAQVSSVLTKAAPAG